MSSDPSALARPLLSDAAPPADVRAPRPSVGAASSSTPYPTPVSAAAAKARGYLRYCASIAFAHVKAERMNDPGAPSLAAAREHMRYFLPKTADGKLLSLFCSESEFGAHVGEGVAIYMHFLKNTRRMFAIACVLALPQFWTNATGDELKLRSPFDPACPSSGGLMGIVGKASAVWQYSFYSLLLGNVSFERTRGWPHLVSEMLLSSLFCVYVYFIWQYNNRMIEKIESEKISASDFAVWVNRLPPIGSDPASLKEHFSFFGPVASVAVSNDHHRLLKLLARHSELKTRWRHLHLEYGRALRAVRASTHSPSGVQLRAPSGKAKQQLEQLLGQIERHWSEVLRSRVELRAAASSHAVCTGHAVVIFRQLADAARCVRHFELIKRHERSRGGASDGPLDFRQLYFRSHHKLDVSRSPEPSDILWANLRVSRAYARGQNLKTTAIILTIAAVSTILITFSSLSSILNGGLLTTLWATPLLIASNVVIFISVPQLALRMEKHATKSSLHMHMLLKMFVFQFLNTAVASLVFMGVKWSNPPPDKRTCPLLHPPDPPDGPCASPDWSYFDFDTACMKHWYTTGVMTLFSAVIGDLIVINGLIDFVRPDKLIIRYLVAPRKHTQAEMNASYELDTQEVYLPFRYQLVLKTVCVTLTFCSAMPILLPLAFCFMYVSYRIDRYNLLRVFKAPPRTTDRTVAYSVVNILPIAVFGHVFFAIFFYSKQANARVPVLFYCLLMAVMIIVMVRVTSSLSSTARPIKELYTAGGPMADADADDDDDMMTMMGSPAHTSSHMAASSSHSRRLAEQTSLAAHLDSIELYVAPLSAQILNDYYQTTAATCDAAHRVASSTRDVRDGGSGGAAAVEPLVLGGNANGNGTGVVVPPQSPADRV